MPRSFRRPSGTPRLGLVGILKCSRIALVEVRERSSVLAFCWAIMRTHGLIILVLLVVQVAQTAQADFASLLDFLKPAQMQDPKGSTVILAMKAIVSICQRRPKMLGRGLPALLNAASQIPAGCKTISASVQNNLKTCLLTMLKHIDPAVATWRDKVNYFSL